MSMVQQQQLENGEYLTFTLGDEQYGVDILKVQEIRGWEPLREIHDVPAYVKGVMDFRGVILPVIDLRIRFGIDTDELPQPLKASALWDNDWDLQSDWYEWEVVRPKS